MRNILVSPVLFVLLILSAAPLYAQKVIPPGTAIMVRLDQSISSKNASANQKVKARIAQDVVIHGKILIPRGSPAAVYVAEAVPSGHSSAPAKLVLRLDAVTVGGRAYPISAYSPGANGKSQKKQGEVAVGGAAAFGTSGAAASTTDISLQPETALGFRLKSSLRIH